MLQKGPDWQDQGLHQTSSAQIQSGSQGFHHSQRQFNSDISSAQLHESSIAQQGPHMNCKSAATAAALTQQLNNSVSHSLIPILPLNLSPARSLLLADCLLTHCLFVNAHHIILCLLFNRFLKI